LHAATNVADIHNITMHMYVFKIYSSAESDSLIFIKIVLLLAVNTLWRQSRVHEMCKPFVHKRARAAFYKSFCARRHCTAQHFSACRHCTAYPSNRCRIRKQQYSVHSWQMKLVVPFHIWCSMGNGKRASVYLFRESREKPVRPPAGPVRSRPFAHFAIARWAYPPLAGTRL
jgi:hypothetical protein